jgi:hypothetical protein
MAVEHIKSTPVTNSDTLPRTLNNARVTSMEMREAVGLVEASAAASVGSTYRFCRVPSHARISQILFASDASGATGQVDVGVYQTAANGGAVVDADFFATALDPGGAAIASVDITHESGTGTPYTIDKAEMPFWQALGLTSDPQRDYDIVATVTEIIADATTMVLKARFGQ